MNCADVTRRWQLIFTFPAAPSALPVLRSLHPGWEWSEQGFKCWMRDQKLEVILHNGPEVRQWLTPIRRNISTLQMGFCEPRESGIEPPYREMGTAAADVVIRQLQMGELGLPPRPRAIVLEGVWKEGETLLSVFGGHANEATSAAPRVRGAFEL